MFIDRFGYALTFCAGMMTGTDSEFNTIESIGIIVNRKKSMIKAKDEAWLVQRKGLVL